MNRMSLYKKIFSCLLVMMGSYSLYSQTASATEGCAELTVEFSAPTLSSYFWRFGEGGGSVSTLQNPVHSYIQPGIYQAQLFEGENGPQIGENIEITVFAPIEIDITADARTGCAPMEINFTSDITIDDGIVIEQIIWTFGDGNSASGPSTSYTYPQNGVYTVSVKVIASDSIKCDAPVIFEDYIALEGVPVTYSLNQSTTCDVPDEFIFTNTTEAEPGSTFFWDFDNGETENSEGPHTITYDAPGVYFPVLTITSPGGCESSLKRTVSVGPPIITPLYPDTICFGEEVVLNHSTIARDFIWDFTGAPVDTSVTPLISELKRPTVLFTEPGLHTFLLTAIAVDGCETTETLDIFVLVPDASFTLGPEVSCLDPLLIEFTANDPNHQTYIFNNNPFGTGLNVEFDEPTGATEYELPDRDTYYQNALDSVTTRLIVSSAQGCTDTSYLTYFIQRPEAFFIPDVVRGCVPFEVNFTDLSFSEFDIQTRFWDYGDGGQAQFMGNDTVATHVYTTPGIHEATLLITDVEGCKDISREVQIVAIDKDSIPAPGAPCAKRSVCVDEPLELIASAAPNTAIHFESDEGRFNHCWLDLRPSHAYQYPGTYPLNYTFEFSGVFIDSVVTGCVVDVLGSRSEAEFFTDCANPYVVEFRGENSINADEYTWYLEGQVISNQASFTHTFDERGEYTIYLDTRQNGVDCLHRDSVEVFITEVMAAINVPSVACASNPVSLNAFGSQDVHTGGKAGYTWLFEDQRPRQIDDEVIDHFLEPGFQTVTLVVEDINGCTDSISTTTTVYDLQADFIADTLVCLPSDASLTNLTTSDTTIVSWLWDFGGSTSTLEDPGHLFDTLDYDPELLGDSITVSLLVTDVIGCTDTSEFLITTYEIFSELFMNNGPVICENESITFDAADFNESGSFLTYEWDFDQNGISTEDSPSVLFTEAGEQLVTLTYTEASSGCQKMIDTLITVLPTPGASFITDQDSIDFICFPEQIQFTNTSDIGENGLYFWDFGNGDMSNIENPKNPFDKGTWDVQLIVFTPEGCVDTVVQSYTLVGPEGDFTVDKDEVCPGEEITFTLINSIDVDNYTWDFDDGTQIHNQTPVTHIYAGDNSNDMFTPRLILRSDEDGCDLSLDLPISLSSIEADIQLLPMECPGELSLTSTFNNPQSITWDIDGQIITGVADPTVMINSEEDLINVILTVTDANGCAVSRDSTFENVPIGSTTIEFPNVFSPNGDDNNPVFNIYYDQDMVTSEVEVIEFKVYNRWGELLYDNQNPTLGWDGRYKGEIVPADVYAYFIEVSVGCLVQSKKGNVTVIK